MKLRLTISLFIFSALISCSDDDPAINHYVGEYFDGGVVFHVYEQGSRQHGLIVTIADITNAAKWGTYGVDVSGAKSLWNGQSNTNAILAAGATTTDAASLCNALSEGGKDDWYLPALDELNLLFDARYEVNKALSQIDDAQELRFEKYWSSTQTTPELAWYFNFDIGSTYGTYSGKDTYLYVRAVRSF